MEVINFGLAIKHDLDDYEPIVEAFDDVLQCGCKIVETERYSYTRYVIQCTGTLDQFNKLKSLYNPDCIVYGSECVQDI